MKGSKGNAFPGRSTQTSAGTSPSGGPDHLGVSWFGFGGEGAVEGEPDSVEGGSK